MTPWINLGMVSDLILSVFGVLLVIVGWLIRWTKAQQDRKLDELSKMLVEILKQVTSTNGRVIALETWRDNHQAEVGRIMATIDKEFERIGGSIDDVWKEIRKH